MPIYVYETIPSDGSAPERFEILQKMSDPPLTEHPKTGVPVRRTLTTAAVVTKHPTKKQSDLLSQKNLEKNGFTKYEKVGDGEYVRTAGTQGPERFRKPAADG